MHIESRITRCSCPVDRDRKSNFERSSTTRNIAMRDHTPYEALCRDCTIFTLFALLESLTSPLTISRWVGGAIQ